MRGVQKELEKLHKFIPMKINDVVQQVIPIALDDPFQQNKNYWSAKFLQMIETYLEPSRAYIMGHFNYILKKNFIMDACLSFK